MIDAETDTNRAEREDIAAQSTDFLITLPSDAVLGSSPARRSIASFQSAIEFHVPEEAAAADRASTADDDEHDFSAATRTPNVDSSASDKGEASGTEDTIGKSSKGRTFSSILVKKCQDVPFTPCTVSFHNLSYKISLEGPIKRLARKAGAALCVKRDAPAPDQELGSLDEKAPRCFSSSTCVNSPTEKIVLHPFSGYVEPGELLAIMGPSGSGKTSFLNCLSGRLRTGELNGQVLYNGVPYDSKMNGNLLGYVMQEDALLENLTVRETLSYALELRNEKISRAVRDERVRDVIEELGLQKCADSLIGGSFRRGISGGEKKRVSIAVELLGRPSVLFLDEPTSGLDSTTAKNLIETLVALSTQKRTIIFTIHQPQSGIYDLFDRVLLLAHGRVMYMGPSEDTVPYYAALGYECPRFTNPSDFFLDTVSSDASADILAQTYATSVYRKQNESNCSIWKQNESGFDFSQYLAIDPGSFFRQFWVLFRRNLRESSRNKMATLTRILQTIFMAFFCGLLYRDMPNSQASIVDRRGALFFMSIQQAMSGLLAIIGMFQSEKVVYYREHDSRMYGTSSYFFAKVIAEIPMTIVAPLLFVIIAYPLVGLQMNIYLALMCVACLIMSTLVAQALGLIIGTLSPSYDIANVIAPAILGFLVIFGGLLISTNSVPYYMKWIPALDFVKYTFEVLSYNEFKGLDFTCTAEQRHGPGLKCPISTGDEAMLQFGIAEIDIGYNFAVMTALLGGFLLLAYVFLRFEFTRG